MNENDNYDDDDDNVKIVKIMRNRFLLNKERSDVLKAVNHLFKKINHTFYLFLYLSIYLSIFYVFPNLLQIDKWDLSWELLC